MNHSMLPDLKHTVYLANMELVNFRLVLFSWGNVSGIDRKEGLMVIKPSGISYDELQPEKMVVVDLDGKVVEGSLKPSSDTMTHLELYKNFANITGVVHTHSEWATSWAQADRSIPVFGTTHADTFHGDIPCTRALGETETGADYEIMTGKVIVETFRDLNPDEIPSVLVSGHGPFSWGTSPSMAVHNAVVLEYIARLAYRNVMLGKNDPIDKHLLDRHFLRKHGKNAYYGQK